LIIFFLSGNVFAQKMIQIGVQAGANGSILSTSMPDYYTHLSLGFRGGVFTRINLGILNITPEINFSMVGSDGTFANDPNRSYSTKTNTFEMPVLLGIRLAKGKLINFRTQFGGFWAWNITNSIMVHDHVFSQNDTLITNANGAKFNGGIVLGVGLDIWRFNLEMRYQWGLANLFGNNIVYQDPRAGFRYSGFSVTLGFSFYNKQF
jgi:hypothetical protein